MIKESSDGWSANARLLVCAAALFVAACEAGPTGQAAAPVESTATAGLSAPVQAAPSRPQGVYSIARVTPVIPAGSDIGWFSRGGGSPRDVGAFVGSAAIDGLSGAFSGDRPLALELQIRQFRPVTQTDASLGGGTHRVQSRFVLRDDVTGAELASSNQNMDLLAIGGVAGEIARNAGRTPEVRLTERIAAVASAWAAGLTCDDLKCPQPTIVAAQAPTPAPTLAPKSTPVPAAKPTPAPEPEATPVAAVAAVGAAVAAPFVAVREAIESLSEPEKGTEEVAEQPAPAPESAPAPEPEVASVEEGEGTTGGFFNSLFGDNDRVGEEETVAAVAPTEPASAPEPVPTPQTAPAPAPETAAAEAAEAASAEEGDSTVGGFFNSLFGDSERSGGEETAAATPTEPAPKPVPTPQPAPAPAAQPELAPAPKPAAAPTPASAPVADPAPAQQAGSPFFRSPASEPAVLPQTALLGRQQRANDPLRRQQGDVVLEIANLPSYWDGDATTGGVWVALPYAPAYRRAIVTNPSNGRTVEANLFWRDPQAGGGSTLLSSEAAAALGVAPGQVTNLGVKVIAAD